MNGYKHCGLNKRTLKKSRKSQMPEQKEENKQKLCSTRPNKRCTHHSLVRGSRDFKFLTDDELCDLADLRLDAPSSFLGVVDDIVAFALGLFHPGASCVYLCLNFAGGSCACHQDSCFVLTAFPTTAENPQPIIQGICIGRGSCEKAVGLVGDACVVQIR